MDGDTSPWHGRRVLVAGCTGFLGTAVTRELLARGAVVVGLVRDRGRAAVFGREMNARRFHLVRGRVEDAARLHSALAIHEVSAAFDLTGAAGGTAALQRAAGLYHPQIPVVAARPQKQLRVASDSTLPNSLGVARFGGLFGPGPRAAKEVAAPADRTVRDYVFVRDAARACLAVAEAVAIEGRGHDLTFRSGWALTAAALAALLAGRAPGREPETPPNPLGWRPEITLADALAETIAWYREESRPRRADTQPVRHAA